jgi:phosphate transport system substrate-binding protein
MMRTWASLLLLGVSLVAQASEQIRGAGATFPAPIYEKWIAAFQEKYPGMEISYQASGSEDGISRLKDGSVDFAASDFLPEEIAQKPELRTLPMVVGGVVPAYNLPGVARDLKFSGKVLAAIFDGRITKWNDKQIAALNHEVKLPAHEIAVVHRADGSGTTFVFSDFLSKTSAEWKAGAHSTLDWPVGQGARGNEGVAEKLAATEYSIGYVEFIYAVRGHLSFGSVENAAGKFVRADIDSITVAAKSARTDSDFRTTITNAPSPDAYPIASFTWILLPNHMNPEGKRQRMIEFLDWALSSGQNQAAALGYVALPAEITELERKVIANRYLAAAQ